MINRFLFSKQNKHRSRTIKTIFSLVFSTFVMLFTISFMNHLQNNQMDLIKSIKSFPLVVTTKEDVNFEEYKTFKYKEEYGLLTSSNGVRSVIIRYIDESYLGNIELFGLDELVVSPSIGLEVSSLVEITRLVKTANVSATPKKEIYEVSGYYNSSYYDFNKQYVFLPLSYASDNLETKIAFLDIDEEKVYNELKDDYEVLSFKEAEASLYGAFIMEKALVFILLFSLFIIIFVQCIYNAKLFALDKEKEIASLYILGMSKRELCLMGAKLGFCLSFIALVLAYILTIAVLYLFNKFNPMGVVLYFPSDIYIILCIINLLVSTGIYILAFRSKTTNLKEVVSRV